MIHYERDILKTSFLDPNSEFQRREISLEIRYDPLTKKPSRIVEFRYKSLPKRDLSIFYKISPEDRCPFCEKNIEKATPKFLEEFYEDGRIKVGEAKAFPNLMPYEKNSIVVVISKEHILSPAQINESLINDALLASKIYIELCEKKLKTEYHSLNWNYMPASGAGFIHPHIQVFAQKRPSSLFSEILNCSFDYKKRFSSNFWLDLIEREKDGERYLGRVGNSFWFLPFSPKSMLFDIAFVVKDKASFLELNDSEIQDLAKGISGALKIFEKENIYAFNMVIFGAGNRKASSYFLLNGRFVARFTVPPIETSDCNYLEKCHGEVFSIIKPEDMRKRIEEYRAELPFE